MSAESDQIAMEARELLIATYEKIDALKASKKEEDAMTTSAIVYFLSSGLLAILLYLTLLSILFFGPITGPTAYTATIMGTLLFTAFIMSRFDLKEQGNL